MANDVQAVYKNCIKKLHLNGAMTAYVAIFIRNIKKNIVKIFLCMKISYLGKWNEM